jgi:uncharacterized protein (DUF433 family)
MTISDRFWAKVDRRGPDECWPWTGSREGGGYGRLRVKGRLVPATHIAYVIAHGHKRPEAHVLHTCDNPPCCNPAHLFLGDPGVNARDRSAKGRQHNFPKGVEHPNAKLTPAAVRTIREWAPAGWSHRELAEAFAVTRRTIANIIHGRTWQHV